MAAIWAISDKSNADAERIWTEPDPNEMLAIWKLVTDSGIRGTTEYYWGASGYQWGDAI
jgi:hypothetical protein